MEAKELMIEDWVYSTFCDKPCKVVCVEQYESGYANVKVTNISGTKDINSLTAIPLTPEIFEKNGFRKSISPPGIHAKCYEIENKDEKYCLTIANYNKYKRLLLDIDSEDSECFNIKCDYVHQLQHALRLCGIEKEIIL